MAGVFVINFGERRSRELSAAAGNLCLGVNERTGYSTAGNRQIGAGWSEPAPATGDRLSYFVPVTTAALNNCWITRAI